MIYWNKIRRERRQYKNDLSSIKLVCIRCDACNVEKWIHIQNARRYIKKRGNDLNCKYYWW